MGAGITFLFFNKRLSYGNTVKVSKHSLNSQCELMSCLVSASLILLVVDASVGKDMKADSLIRILQLLHRPTNPSNYPSIFLRLAILKHNIRKYKNSTSFVQRFSQSQLSESSYSKIRKNQKPLICFLLLLCTMRATMLR